MLRNRPRPTKGLAPPACAKLYFGSQTFKAGTTGVRLVLARAPLISAAPACPHRESAAPEEQAAVKDQRNSVQHSGPAQGKKYPGKTRWGRGTARPPNTTHCLPVLYDPAFRT